MTGPKDLPSFSRVRHRRVTGSIVTGALWLLMLAGFVATLAGPVPEFVPRQAPDVATIPCPPTCEPSSG